MAEVYDWQDYIDKDGEFAPIEKPGEADAQDVPTAVHKNNNSGNFITRHPKIFLVFACSALYWSGMLGTNHKGSIYQKVKPTPGSFYIGDSHKGAEFFTPTEGYKDFYCGKRLTPLQKDENFKKVIELVPGESYVHITCEGTDAWTPKDLSESVATPPTSSSQPPYLEDIPSSPYTPEPEYYEPFPSDPS